MICEEVTQVLKRILSLLLALCMVPALCLADAANLMTVNGLMSLMDMNVMLAAMVAGASPEDYALSFTEMVQEETGYTAYFDNASWSLEVGFYYGSSDTVPDEDSTAKMVFVITNAQQDAGTAAKVAAFALASCLPEADPEVVPYDMSQRLQDQESESMFMVGNLLIQCLYNDDGNVAFYMLLLQEAD